MTSITAALRASFRALALSGIWLAAWGARSAMGADSPAPAPLPLTDNTAPPHTVVEGSIKRLKQGYFEAYGRWTNRSVLWAEDFVPMETWDAVRGGGWQLRPWGEWVRTVPGRRLVLSVPMLVGNWKGDGPATGTDAGIPVSLEQGAAGRYNEHFVRLAENLAANGLGDTILRLGWEFNGGWYPWRAGKQNSGAFAAYWRQIVSAMRGVPGAENLRFCWNPTVGLQGSRAFDAWPGDEFVDCIGLDVYDQCWLPEIYPLPEGAGPEEIALRRDRNWTENLNSAAGGRDGLAFWREFARSHGDKPLAICEWGLVDGKHGGRDNPGFIERMHRFITDPANNVLFHCYFDVKAPDGDHMLFACGDDEKTRMPESAARFQQLFSLPGKTTP